MGDLGVQVFVRLSVRTSVGQSSFRQHLPWVSCERNSSYEYSFVPLILKLCKCFRHGKKMCMWFGYILHVFSSWYEDVHVVWVKLFEHFCHFFHIVNLVIFSLTI